LKSKRAVSIIVFFIIVSTSIIVYAHKPIFISEDIGSIERAQLIEKPEISWAVYNMLEQKREVDFYKIEGKKGMKVYLQMTIPKLKGLESFNPTVILMGREFPEVQREIPFDLPEGYGGMIIGPRTASKIFFEPFTQTRYIIRQEERITLQRDETYYIAVYSEDEKTGKYTLAIGEKEEFGFADIIKFPITWLKVRLWYNKIQTYLILIVLLMIFIGGIYGIKRILRRIRK